MNRKIWERYHNDANFATMVDLLVNAIQDSLITPMETREAAMLAQYIYESKHSRTRIILESAQKGIEQK